MQRRYQSSRASSSARGAPGFQMPAVIRRRGGIAAATSAIWLSAWALRNRSSASGNSFGPRFLPRVSPASSRSSFRRWSRGCTMASGIRCCASPPWRPAATLTHASSQMGSRTSPPSVPWEGTAAASTAPASVRPTAQQRRCRPRRPPGSSGAPPPSGPACTPRRRAAAASRHGWRRSSAVHSSPTTPTMIKRVWCRRSFSARCPRSRAWPWAAPPARCQPPSRPGPRCPRSWWRWGAWRCASS
mmetsp:Transcript_122839/g.348175  ORF Transcript_122839/g.348175 Transcript_122839/m.348175 type:complete len:244 (+) Transcript_122839:134-865(+)